jgi:hypothetical protein
MNLVYTKEYVPFYIYYEILLVAKSEDYPLNSTL